MVQVINILAVALSSIVSFTTAVVVPIIWYGVVLLGKAISGLFSLGCAIGARR